MIGTLLRRVILLALAVGLIWVPGAATQTPQRLPAGQPQALPQQGTTVGTRVTPKLEPIAETRLLMEGVAHTNFRGVERLLKQKPADVQTWTFVRGQALLIAEVSNLLMLRPPRNQGQPVWFERSMDLRKAAVALGQAAGTQDYPATRAAFVAVANQCNRCHQSFRVPVEIEPFAEPAPPGKISLAP